MLSFRKRRNARNKTVTNDVFLNIQNGCGDISGLNSSISNDDLFQIVDDQPCVSAVCFGRFESTCKLIIKHLSVTIVKSCVFKP